MSALPPAPILTPVLAALLDPLGYQFMQRALAAALLVGVTCGLLGCHIILRRLALMGDAISHAVLPGITIAYLLKVSFFLGAVVTGVATALGIGFVTRNSRVKEDSAMGILFTAAFAFGILILSRIRAQVDLMHVLFGNVLGVALSDLWITAAISAIVLGLLFALHKEWCLTGFDPVFAEVSGLPTRALHYLLMGMLSLTVVAALQTVGLVLVVSMLITPAATAFLLTHRLSAMLAAAAGFGAGAAVIGLYLSYHLDVSSGAAIVLVSTLFFFTAMLASPKGGPLARWWEGRRLGREGSPPGPA